MRANDDITPPAMDACQKTHRTSKHDSRDARSLASRLEAALIGAVRP